MTITTTNSFSGPLTPNGVTTEFPFTFTALEAGHVEVILRDDATLAETIVSSNDYTVALTPGGGGTVTFNVAPASGQTVWLRLNADFQNEIVFGDGSALLATLLNATGNEATTRAQTLLGYIERTILAPLGEAQYTMRPNSELDGKPLGVSGRVIVPNEASGAAEGPLEILAAETSTSVTLALTDAYKGKPFDNASPITVTVPPIADVPFDDGAFIEIYQDGAGAVTFTAGAGVTLRSRGGRLTTAGQHSTCALRHRGSNVWQVVGDVTA